MNLSAIYIILAASIWGIDGFVRQNTPLGGDLLVAIESTIAGLLLLAFLFFFRKHHIKKVTNIPSFIAMILVGGVAGSWCFVKALAATQSLGFVFVLIGLQPIFTIMSSAILLGEHPKGSFYAFAATTVFASILLTLGDTGFTLNAGSLTAYMYALMTAICWGSSTTINKIVITHNSSLFSLSMRFLFTGLIGWGIVAFSHEMISAGEIMQKISINPINILFLIFISDIFSMAIYFKGLRDVPAALSSIFELAFPLTGFVLDYILYDSVPSPMKAVAALTILASIVLLPYCHFIEENHTSPVAVPS